MRDDGTPPAPPPAPGARAAERKELLRAQPWARILTQLTAIAFKRTRCRTMDDAQDLAQTAITDAYRSLESGGWDPCKGPLMSFLVATVIGLGGNQRRRKRNTCEVWLDEEWEEAEGLCKHEAHFDDGRAAPDEALHSLRFASTLHARLLERLEGDALAIAIMALMKDGVATPADLAAATGQGIEEVRGARRRVRYHAEEITKELSASAAPSGATTGSNEVMQ